MFQDIFKSEKQNAQEKTEESNVSKDGANTSPQEVQTEPYCDIELTWAPLFSHPTLQRAHLTQVEQINQSPPRLLQPQPQRPDQIAPPILHEYEESYQGHPPAYQPFPPEMEEEAKMPPSPVVIQPVYVVDPRCCNCGHKWGVRMLEDFLDEAPAAAVQVAPTPPFFEFQEGHFPVQNYPGHGLQGNPFVNYPGNGFQGNPFGHQQGRGFQQNNYSNYPDQAFHGNPLGNIPNHGFQGNPFANHPGHGFQGLQGPTNPVNFQGYNQAPYFPGNVFGQNQQGPSFHGFNQERSSFWGPYQGPNFPGLNFQGVPQDPFNGDLFNRPNHDFLGAVPHNQQGQFQAPFQNNENFRGFGIFHGPPVENHPPAHVGPPSERPLSLSSEEESEESEEEYDSYEDEDEEEFSEESSDELSEELLVCAVSSERYTVPFIEHAVLRVLQTKAGSNLCSPDLDEEECCNILDGFFERHLPVPEYIPLQGPYKKLHWNHFLPVTEEEVFPSEAVDVSDPEEFFHDSEYESDEEFYRPRSRTFDDLSDDESVYDTAIESPGDFNGEKFATACEFFEEELLSSCLSLSSLDGYSSESEKVEPQPAPVLTAMEKARFKRFTKLLNKKPQASTFSFSTRRNPFLASPFGKLLNPEGLGVIESGFSVSGTFC